MKAEYTKILTIIVVMIVAMYVMANYCGEFVSKIGLTPVA